MFFQATQRVLGGALDLDLVKAPVNLGVSTITTIGSATLDTVVSIYSCRDGMRLKLTKPHLGDVRNCLYVLRGGFACLFSPPTWVLPQPVVGVGVFSCWFSSRFISLYGDPVAVAR